MVGIPWLVDASLQSLSPLHDILLSVCVSVFISPSSEDDVLNHWIRVYPNPV